MFMLHKRFWITVFCFAITNILAWAAFHHAYQLKTLNVLKIERFNPGNNIETGTRPVLSWEFNLDMVCEDVSSKVIIKSSGDASYLIPGHWEWVNTRKLTFTPQKDLPKATAFTFTFPLHSLKSKEGFLLNQSYSATVKTPALQILSVRQAAFDEKNQFMIEIEFNDKMLPTEVAKFLEIESLVHQKIPFRLYEGVTANVIRVMTEPTPFLYQNISSYLQVIVRIREGLCGISGPLGLTNLYETQLTLNRHLMITKVEPYSSSKGKIRLQLYFNNDVDIEILKEILSIEPILPFTLIREWFGVSLEADFIPGNRYALKVNAPRIKNDSKNYPQEDLFSVFIPDRKASVWFEQDHGFLGAKGNRMILAHAINVQNIQITLTKMYENNIVHWRNTVYENQWMGLHHFSQVIAQKSLKLEMEKNKVQDIHLSLDELLPENLKQNGVYEIQIKAENENQGYAWELSDTTVVTLSDIGLVAKRFPHGLFVWTLSLSTGKPMEHVRIRLFSNKNQLLGEGISDENGIIKINTIETSNDEKPVVVVANFNAATEPAHLTWLDLRTSELSYSHFDISGSPYSSKAYEAFVYSERGAYRPGEKVHLWAIIRGPHLSTPEEFPVWCQFYRPDGRNWKGHMAKVDSSGMVYLSVKLPQDIPTGNWTVSIGLPKSKDADAKTFGTTSFFVEEFIPDRMKVALNLKNIRHDRYTLSSQSLSVHIAANYLFGQPASGTDATLSSRLDPAPFKPKHWKEWTFTDSANAFKTLGGILPQGQSIESPKIKLNEKGKGEWKVDLSLLLNHPPNSLIKETPSYTGPWQLTVLGSVQEMGGRAVSATKRVFIDTVPYYVGIRPQQNQKAQPGSPYVFDIACVSGHGQIAKISKQMEIQLFRETWNNIMTYRDGSYHYDSTRILEKASSSYAILEQEKGHFEIIPPSEGSYVIAIKDSQTGSFTSHGFYVSSENGWEDSVSRENPEQLQIEIIPMGKELKNDSKNVGDARRGAPSSATFTEHDGADERQDPLLFKKTHFNRYSSSLKVGGQAQVIVRSPFPGQLLLTIETENVLFHKVLTMTQSHISIPIDILESYRPNAYVSATVIQPVHSKAPWKIHRAFGVTRLAINNNDQKLKIKIQTKKEILPKNKIRVEAKVLTPQNKPAKNARVTLLIVDEGILQLTNFSPPDPFSFFHRNRALNVFVSDLYGELFPEIPKINPKSSVGGDGGYEPRHLTPLSIQRMKNVALVSKVLRCDENGNVKVDFRLPEFTGQLRVMAIAHSKKFFGSASKPIFVKSPLMLQSTTPRFAANNDHFEIPIVIFNHTGSEGIANLSIELDNKSPVYFPHSSERKINFTTNSIPDNAQTVITIPLKAKNKMGIARLKIKAQLNGQEYQQNLIFPIRPACPSISEGGYATLKPHQDFKIRIPEKWIEGTTQLNIHVTPFPTLNLTKALDYLNEYPHGCAEQTVSTTFPLIGLQKLGEKIFPEPFNTQYIHQRVETALNRLISMQTAEGGLAMWPGYTESWSWASVYATHFITEAENAGFSIPTDFRDRLLNYVRKLLNESSDQPNILEIQAYACFVLAKAGYPQRSMMSRLEDIFQRPSTLPTSISSSIHPSTRFYLALAWLYSGRRDLALKLIPQNLPHPRQNRDLSGNIGSPIRDQAILIQSLIELDPQNPALPKLVKELAQAGGEKKWQSTQDHAFALLALGSYLKETDFGEPFTSAELWAGTEKISETGNGDSLLWNSSNKFLNGKEFSVKISGAEKTKGYVAWSITGLAKEPPLNEDHGISVRKRYLDQQGHAIALDKICSGDLIQVEIHLECPLGYDNMVIEDLLPAGLEIENPRLATSASILKDPTQTTFMDSHIDIRDDRLVLYGKMLDKGKAQYTYLARAVTPGTFTVPPVKAECMYDISINSISRDNETMKIATHSHS